MRYSDAKYDTLYLLFYAVGNVPLFLKHRETAFDTSRRHVRTQWVMRPFFEATIGINLMPLDQILPPILTSWALFLALRIHSESPVGPDWARNTKNLKHNCMFRSMFDLVLGPKFFKTPIRNSTCF